MRTARRFDFATRLAAGVFLLNLIVGALLALSLFESRRLHEEKALATARNLALLIEQELTAAFNKIDLTLQAVVDETHRLRRPDGTLDGAALNAFIERQVARLPEISGLRLADAQGLLRHGTGLSAGKDINIADRDHFIHLRAHPQAGAFIGQVTQSRLSGKGQLVLARRLDHADGSFAGTAGAILEMDKLTAMLAGLDLGPRGVVALQDRNLALVARQPELSDKPTPIGQRNISDQFSASLQRAPLAGTFVATSPLDGLQRTFSYRQLASHRLYVMVGFATADYLGEWWRDVLHQCLLLLAFVLTTLGLSSLALRMWQRREDDLAQIQQQEQKFRSLFEALPDPLVITDAQGLIVLVNHQVTEVLGYPAQELVGQPVEVLLPQRYRAGHASLRQSYTQAPRVREMGKSRLLWALTRQGREIPINVSLSPIQTEQGMMVAAIIRDVSDRQAAEERIAYLAYHDALTGLPNRQLIQDRFQQAMAHSDRVKNRAALLLLNLDSFKPVNDSLGFPAGDTLLQQVARRLGSCVRDGDTLGRQGSDEFLVMLTDLPDTESIIQAALRLHEQLEKPFQVAGQEVLTTASIGIAIYPDDGADFDALLKKADLAMFQAKQAGRNTYRFFDSQVNQGVADHLRLRMDLRHALERHELVLHYQPQIDLGSNAVIGVEALLRWQHPELGLLPPGRFIAAAEESGLIVPMGEWVLAEACRQAMAWHAAGFPELVMAVNLSAVQFKRGELEQTILRVLQDSGLPPARLELELTESILLGDTDQVLETVNRIKALGVQLSIDDFGTGYSSLSYLKRFPFDKLKIDQSFVRDLARDPENAAIVRTIIQLAHGLGLRTIAEGVEDASLLHYLRLFRCDEAQGYHIARPQPADAISAYLAARKAAPAD